MLFQRTFTVSIKMPIKFKCFMLQSQKLKYLVLTRYPPSDPQEILYYEIVIVQSETRHGITFFLERVFVPHMKSF